MYIQYATLRQWSFPGLNGTLINVLHIARHEFTTDEVEEVFAGSYKVRRARQKRYIALGKTLDGRLAFVVFQRLARGRVRVITARDMDDNERRLFRRK